MNKSKVLFVCIGNSCRSQMAEGFARTYGSDVLIAESAGLAPAFSVAELTREVMAEKNIDLSHHVPKSLIEVDLGTFDLLINMSGQRFPPPGRARVREWPVEDPIGKPKDVHLRVAQEIENLVMHFILELRRAAPRG